MDIIIDMEERRNESNRLLVLLLWENLRAT